MATNLPRVVFAISSPRVIFLDGFLSDEECDYLISLAQPSLQPAEVYNMTNDTSVLSEVRICNTTNLQRCADPVVSRIEERIEELTGISCRRGEEIQILNYGPGGEYQPHHDFFEEVEGCDSKIFDQGGQRVATFLMYLNDVPSGGETAFPELNLKVTPKKGSALFFAYATSRTSLDLRLLHAGMPVILGEKWVATRWIREFEF